MRRNRTFLQSIFLRVHYRTALAFISIFLGVLAFSGFYFFGQNIVNEADTMQWISRDRVRISDDVDETQNETDISPTETSEIATPTQGIGGTSVSPSPTIVTPSVSSTISPTASPSATPTPIALDLTKFLKGDPNAEKTIIAYYDFECQYCKLFITETLPLLQTEYFDTGKAKLIFKNYPLSSHPNAPIVHNATLCASVPGNFWKFHDIVFDKQSEWSGKSAAEITAFMKSYYTTQFGKSQIFDQCVDDMRYITQVEKDKSEGKNAGVTGTPTFIIGNEIIVGHQPIETFREILGN